MENTKRSPGHPKTIEGETVRTALWLKKSQFEWLKAEAERRGITASELMRELIDKAKGEG
jgi:predicted DNA-binding ribbon-helix-helix protein